MPIIGPMAGDFPQRLRQLRPITSPVDLQAAAFDAIPLVFAGEIDRAQAIDDLYGMATAAGLVNRYGDDAVQAMIGVPFADAPRVPAASGMSNRELDQRAITQVSVLPRVTALTMEAFLKMKIPPRATMLTPWLPERGLAMIYAPRGTGKTRMAHGVAYAIASGSGFLRWMAPQPKRVLLLDGEMPAATLQEMLRATVQASHCNLPDPRFFKIAAADLVRDGLPDLASPSAQQFYCDVVADADLVVVDNLSTLCRSLKENDADSWTPVQSWALGLRRSGKSGLFIHHGGKSGGQRGTSRKEDVLDTVIALRRPPDYLAEQGAQIEIHFEKSRGFHGPNASHSKPAYSAISGPSAPSKQATIPIRWECFESRECRSATLPSALASPNRPSNAS